MEVASRLSGNRMVTRLTGNGYKVWAGIFDLKAASGRACRNSP